MHTLCAASLLVVRDSQSTVCCMAPWVGLRDSQSKLCCAALELGLGTLNPHFTVWPIDFGLDTRNPRFFAWPLQFGLGTLNPRFIACLLDLGLGTLHPHFVVWSFELRSGTLNPMFVAWLSYGYSNQMGYRTSDFRLLWIITLNPPPLFRCWVSPPPPSRANFCSMTHLHALPLCHTLLWKMGNRKTHDMENAPLGILYFSHYGSTAKPSMHRGVVSLYMVPA